MSISLQNLEYFVASAQTGNIRSAADKLFRSYQSISQGIAQLEGELGRALFIRRGAELELTDYGQFVLREYALPMTALLKALHDSGETYDRQTEMKLTVELDSQQCRFASVGIEAANQLRQRFPDAAISCKTMSPDNILQHLQTGEIDLGLRLFTPNCRDVEVCLRTSTELFLYVGVGHRLATRERVRCNELHEETFLFHNPKTYDKVSFWQLSGIPKSRALVLGPKHPLARQLLDSGTVVRVYPRIETPPNEQTSILSDAMRIPFDPPMMVDLCFMKPASAKWKRLMIEYLNCFKMLCRERLQADCEICADNNA